MATAAEDEYLADPINMAEESPAEPLGDAIASADEATTVDEGTLNSTEDAGRGAAADEPEVDRVLVVACAKDWTSNVDDDEAATDEKTDEAVDDSWMEAAAITTKGSEGDSEGCPTIEITTPLSEGDDGIKSSGILARGSSRTSRVAG